MLDKESYILVELLGRDDPKVKALVWAARDPKMRDSVQSMFRNLALERGINPDKPPAFGFADDLETGELIIGRVKAGDNLCQHVGLADKDKPPGHTAILGQSDRGKTFLAKYMAAQAIRLGYKVLVLARDREWRDLLPLFPADTVCIWKLVTLASMCLKRLGGPTAVR